MILLLFMLNFLSIGRADILAGCERLNDLDEYSSFKLRRVRALCDALQISQSTIEHDEIESIPNFDLNQIDTGIIFVRLTERK